MSLASGRLKQAIHRDSKIERIKHQNGGNREKKRQTFSRINFSTNSAPLQLFPVLGSAPGFYYSIVKIIILFLDPG